MLQSEQECDEPIEVGLLLLRVEHVEAKRDRGQDDQGERGPVGVDSLHEDEQRVDGQQGGLLHAPWPPTSHLAEGYMGRWGGWVAGRRSWVPIPAG